MTETGHGSFNPTRVKAASALPLLRIRDLRIEFRTRGGIIVPVDGLSFDVAQGQTLGLVGESGSGKSVTALAIMGLLPKPASRVTSGSICFQGDNLLEKSERYVRELRGKELAIIFQDPLSSLNPVFRIGNQIGESLRRRKGYSRKAARAAAIELLERVGIPGARLRVDDFPHQFSGGMRQRVMIAIALALRPKLVIADEPTTALDVTVQAQIMALLAKLTKEERMSLIVISHDLGVVADIADQVLILYAGRPAEVGDTREVYDYTAHPYTAGLIASIPNYVRTQDRLQPIKGTPPNLLHMPTGCAFHPRCTYAREICGSDTPELRPAPGRSADHRTACHFAEEVCESAAIERE